MSMKMSSEVSCGIVLEKGPAFFEFQGLNLILIYLYSQKLKLITHFLIEKSNFTYTKIKTYYPLPIIQTKSYYHIAIYRNEMSLHSSHIHRLQVAALFLYRNHSDFVYDMDIFCRNSRTFKDFLIAKLLKNIGLLS